MKVEAEEEDAKKKKKSKKNKALVRSTLIRTIFLFKKGGIEFLVACGLSIDLETGTKIVISVGKHYVKLQNTRNVLDYILNIFHKSF